MEVINHIFRDLTSTNLVLGLFVSILYYSVVRFKIKRLFKLSMMRRYKLIDCFECSSFWASLIATQSVFVAMACFVITSIIEELKSIDGEIIIDKPGKGSFYSTDLDLLLKT